MEQKTCKGKVLRIEEVLVAADYLFWVVEKAGSQIFRNN
jgi:hypothetical protein